MKKKPVFKSILIFAVLILINSVSFARIYYVSSSYTGATSNGNFTTPWKSLNDVQSNQGVLLPGDVISFKCDDVFSGTLNITKSGTNGFPITFNSYGTGSKPKFTGTGNTISYLFYLYNKNYIVFDGLEIIDPTISSTDRNILSKIQRAFGFDGTSSYNTIRNCKISLVGVGAYWVGSNNSMDHCDIGNLRMIVNDATVNNDYGANPVVISSANNRITNNYFHDCWANSFDYVYDGGAVEFYGNGSSNNFICYNTFFDCNGVVENGSGNGGLIENNEFSYNKFINNGSLFYINNSGTFLVSVSNMKFYNNVIVENAVNRVFENNLGGMSTSVSNQGIVVFKNNVFQLSTGVDVARSGQWTGGQLIHENNVYKLSNASYTNFTLNPSEITTSQTIWTNTSNTNAVLWDFTPTSNSQLINFGQNIGLTVDFVGNSIVSLPDAGVIEKQNSTPISPLTITISNSTIICNGEKSTINVSASGGTSPYNGTGIFYVNAGTYNYTVIDANGVSATTSITITEPPKINLNAFSGVISVYGGVTTITVNASGGTGTLNYQLNNGSYQTSNIFNNVAAGNYTIRVKDQNNCLDSVLITVTQPEKLNIAINASAILCRGDSSAVTVTASGGIPPYIGTGTYKVPSGNYNFSVSDSNLNVVTASITISQPDAIVVSYSYSPITVSGGSTTLTINATGGVGEYYFALGNNTYQSSNIFSNVTAGTYLISVKDGNNCINISSIQIIESQTSSPLSLTLISKLNVSCRRMSDGYIEVMATGGVQPYQYSINNGSYGISNKFYNLKAGTYTIKVKDYANNVTQITVNILDSKKRCFGKIMSGTGEISSNHDITQNFVYPNPTKDIFKLKINEWSFSEVIVDVLNSDGIIVYKTKTSPGKIIEFGNGFKPGIYFVKIIQGNNIDVLKIIKL